MSEISVTIEGNENIAELFSIFHDGVIIFRSFQDGNLTLDVDISYLTERIDPAFEKFNIVLNGVENVRFDTWPKDAKANPRIVSDVTVIFEPELGVLSGESKGNQVQVACDQGFPQYDFCGGYLYFNALNVLVTDETGRPYSIEELGDLCKGYWDDWERKNKHQGTKD